MVYDIWDLAPCPLPPRSRLYSLEPVGIGTAQVESLTSYMMRLAEAHSVSLRTLIHREIFPKLPASPKDTTFERLHSLNGMGSCFEKWVTVLEELTGRDDLHDLTLLPWHNVLSSGGILRQHRAWCPRCLEDWLHSAVPVYEPLLWLLTPVTICPVHGITLEQCCPHCQRRILPLSAHARPGLCSHCKSWLGRDSAEIVGPECKGAAAEQMRTAKELSEFLALGPTVGCLQSHLLQNLDRAVAEFADGSRRTFARAAKISASLLERWPKREWLPSLPIVIRISQRLGLLLTRLLLENIPSTDPSWIRTKQLVHGLFSERRKTFRPQYSVTPVVHLLRLSPEEREAAKAKIKAGLEANLQLVEPRPVEEVFRKLGCRSPSRGRTWFPELCAATKIMRQQRVEVYRQGLMAALTEEPPPTVAQVAQRLGVRFTQLRLRRACRELCKALASRYPDRHRFQRTRIEEALTRALEEAPVPLATLASRLHKNPNALRVTFPDICRRLRARYVAHRALEQQQVRLLYETAVRQAIGEIVDAGEYPSQQRVLSSISERNPPLTSFYLTGLALKRVRTSLITHSAS